jgi:protein-S-isoprenylcysteine O-methyltransferase Ste14
MAGFLVQWPTLLTLLMFPVLVFAYGRLATSEEREVRVEFGAAYEVYATATPRFVPHLGRGGRPRSEDAAPPR